MTEDNLATLGAALIGAILGSVGAVTIEHWLGGRAREMQDRRRIAKGHLYQLLYVLETLWYRIDTLHTWSAELQQKGYFRTSTLYAVGSALARVRLLHVEGVVAELTYTYPSLVTTIREDIRKVFEALGPLQYRRTLLAELLLDWTDSGHRILTYREFWELHSKMDEDDSDLLAEIDPVLGQLAHKKARDEMQTRVEEVARKISDEIGVSSTLRREDLA